MPSEIRYADSHVHLDRCHDGAVAGIIVRARAAGVVEILTVGTDAASSERGAALAGRYAGVHAAAGLHPLRVDPPSSAHEIDRLRRLIAALPDDVRAVGEIGLDATGDAAYRRGQGRAFEEQLTLAADRRLPVVVHSVGAHRETAAVLASFRERLPAVIVHYFAGDRTELERFVELDCHISFGRLLLRPHHEMLRTLVALVPAERLLAETDTYPLPDRVTEPRDVVDIVRALAWLRGEPEAATAALTLANLRRVLTIVG